MYLTNIGKNIRYERKQQHMTIAQLAEKCDISDNFMGNIERGTDIPSLETFIKITNGLLIDANTLLKDEILICSPIAPVDKIDIEINKEIKNMSDKQKQYVLELIKKFKDFFD